MAIETRSYAHSYDNRIRHQFNRGAWSIRSGLVESHNSIVSADYTKRDWKRLIMEGRNATSFLQGQSSGYRSQTLGASVVAALKRPRLDPAQAGEVDVEITYFHKLSPGLVYQQRLKGPLWRQGLITPTDAALLNKLENQALLGFNRKALKARRELQAIVLAGESTESLKMIHSRSRKLRQGVDDYLDRLMKVRWRGRLRRLTNAQKRAKIKDFLSDTWLEYSFGWKPLVNDIRSAAEALAAATMLRPPMKMVSYSAAGMKTGPGAAGSSSGPMGNLEYTRTKEIRSYYAGVKFYGVMKVPTNEDGFDQSRFGVHWNEIIPAAWELIPYSFMLDYFTNIGDLIESQSSLYADVMWMSKGTVTVGESSWSDIQFDVNLTDGWEWTYLRKSLGTRVFRVSRTVQRATYLGSRIPRFEFQIPGMGTKWLNIAALSFRTKKITQRYRGILNGVRL